MLRLRGTAELAAFDSRFARGGGSEPLTAGLSAPLTSQSFAPLGALETQLNRFFTSSQAPVAADPQTLSLGTLDVSADANVQNAPLELALGVLPRLEVGVSVPVIREELLLNRFRLSGGTVGANPSPSANAELFARIGEEWRALGRSSLLPTDSSALGRELQRLVRARVPGSSLDLPDSSASVTVFNQLLRDQFGVGSLESDVGPWRLGDAELSTRVQLVNSLGAASMPRDSVGLHYRAALSVAARVPTGAQPDSLRLLTLAPDVGLGGFGVGLDGDVFWGTRVWTTLSIRYARRSEAEVTRRVVDPSAPLVSLAPARTVRWSPADEVALRVAPRYRLTESISLGAQYSFARLGDSTLELDGGSQDAGVLDLPGGLAQAIGVGMRYSTLGAYEQGGRLLPVEVVLSYESAFSGAAFQPQRSVVLLQASLFHRLWGSAR